ncbi:MAG: pyridoxamine 5'-phosphate oxidase family protein [Rhodomicrobium sp.]
MSAPPQIRRQDLVMTPERTLDTLERGFCGRLSTIGADGYPYCVPLLYVWMDEKIYVHNAGVRGHLRTNVEREPRVCFEVDEPGQVYAYGRFECDASVSYRSVIVFGRAHIVEPQGIKQRFFEMLMAKYEKRDLGQPKGFFPRLNQITCYAVTIERMTGKEIPLPDISMQWPQFDRTKSPKAVPPSQL